MNYGTRAYCALLGIGLLWLGPTGATAQTISITPSQTEGPYYAPNPPLKPDFRPDVAAGTAEDWPDWLLTGRVANEYGLPVSNAKLDFWHADSTGEYDESSVGGRNGTYILRGYLNADELGRFEFNSIMPGLYPGRTRHVHFKVYDGQNVERVTSQLYWASPFDNDVNADGTTDINNGTSLTRDGIYRNNTPLLVEINNDPVADGYFDTSFDFVIRTNDPAPDGADFNGDAETDADDLGILYAGIQDSWNAPALDLSGDMILNSEDVAAWASEVGVPLGDTDFNGVVEFTDFLSLSANFGLAGGWGEGDFDADGFVEFPDFLILSANFGTASEATAVPEPNSRSLVLCVGWLLLVPLRKTS